MHIFEDKEGTYLSMQGYVEMMANKLGLEDLKGRKSAAPMLHEITDFTPCTPEEAKRFMSAAGMLGWISATARPDIRVYHS